MTNEVRKMIYTSYFAQLRNLPENIIPVSICGKAPNWYHGYQYKKLAPKYDFPTLGSPHMPHRQGIRIISLTFITPYSQFVLATRYNFNHMSSGSNWLSIASKAADIDSTAH